MSLEIEARGNQTAYASLYCDAGQTNIHAALGVAIREFPLKSGHGFFRHNLMMKYNHEMAVVQPEQQALEKNDVNPVNGMIMKSHFVVKANKRHGTTLRITSEFIRAVISNNKIKKQFAFADEYGKFFSSAIETINTVCI